MAALTESELHDLFVQCDSNADKVLDMDEFAQLVSKVEKGAHRSRGDLESLFKQVDTNNNGRICFKELQAHFLKK